MLPRALRAALIVTPLLPALLAGQVSRTTYASSGEGQLRASETEAPVTVSRVEATLYRNGGLELRLLGSRDRWAFRGTWTGDPDAGSVGIRLDEAFGRAADGSGRLYLDRTSVDRARFSGSIRDARFDFSFEGRERPDAGGADSAAIATTRNGTGRVVVDTAERPLTRARVRLYPNGRAQLRLWGDDLVTLNGRWNGRLDRDEVRLEIPRWEGAEADLRGTLSLSRRNGWDQLHLEGPTDQGPVRVEFDGSGVALEYDADGPLVEGTDRTMRATGSLTVDRRVRDEAALVRVHLRRDWTWVAQVQGGRERFRFEGTWRQQGRDAKLELQLTGSSLGAGTTGSGTLTMRDADRWRSLELAGRTGSAAWSLSARGTDGVRLLFDPGEDGTPALVTGVTAEAAGTGSLLLPSQPARAVTKLRVVLADGGGAELTLLEGDTTGTLTGRWSPGSRAGRVELEITGGTLKAFRGTGRVELTDALGLARVTMEGRVLRLRTRLDFTATGAPPPRR